MRLSRVHPEAKLPAYATWGSAGADLALCEALTIPARSIALGRTGLVFEIPDGHEGQIRSRSGLAINRGVVVAQGIGTIDSDYRGEVMIPLYNRTNIPVHFEAGARVAQIIFAPVTKFRFEDADGLQDTERSDGGFGSTGVSGSR